VVTNLWWVLWSHLAEALTDETTILQKLVKVFIVLNELLGSGKYLIMIIRPSERIVTHMR